VVFAATRVLALAVLMGVKVNQLIQLAFALTDVRRFQQPAKVERFARLAANQANKAFQLHIPFDRRVEVFIYFLHTKSIRNYDQY